MHIHCPHCRSPIEVVDDQELRDVTCPSCGTSFNLLPDETVTRIAKEQKTLGHFELMDRIGVGAFGEVWTAHDSELDRTVAIKLPRKGQLSADEAESFLREARSAARLNHPSIVAVHEVGKANDQLFIVSDYVRGVTLSDWLTTKRPTPKEAAELVAQLADAVHHAHEHGVIHRDLKPSNIMLDDSGQPHIMDFGLAKREAGEITMTLDGKILGTPAYMSPEQAKGAAHEADARSDVYSLGVVLYEVLTGELPFRGNARMLVHQVINDDPPSPRRLNSALPHDLETIVLKCLEKDPGKRYLTARGLAEDLRMFLEGKAIQARPVGRIARGWRWSKRNPAIAGLATAVGVLLVSGSLVSTFLAVVATQNAAEAHRRAEDNRRLRYASDMILAGSAWDDSNFGMVQQLLRRNFPNKGEVDYRGLEWYLLWECCKPRLESTAMSLESPVAAIDISPNELELAVAYCYGGVSRLDLSTFQQSSRFGGRCNDFFLGVAFSPDGQTLAYVSSPGTNVTLRNLNTNEESNPLECFDESAVNAVAFSADGQFLAASGNEGIRIWDVATQQRLDRFDDCDWSREPAPYVAFSHVGNLLAIANHNKSAIILNLSAASDEVIRLTHNAKVSCVAFSPNGKSLVTGSDDGTVMLWDIESRTCLAEASGWSRAIAPAKRITGIAFSTDEQVVAASSGGYTIELMDAENLTELDVLRGLSGAATDLDFLSDGRLVSAGADSTLTIWPSASGGRSDVFSYDLANSTTARRKNQVALSPNTKSIASTYPGGVQVRDWRGVIQYEAGISVDGLICLALSDDSVLAVGYETGAVLLRDLRDGSSSPIHTALSSDAVTALAFSRDGQMLVVGTGSGVVQTWDVRDRTCRKSVQSHHGVVWAIAISGTRDEFVTASDDQTIKRWSTKDGSYVCDLGRHKGFVRTLAYAPDGVLLASGGFDSTLKVWDTSTPKATPKTVEAHASGAFAVAFSPDGRMLATGGRDGEFKLWDTDSLRQRFTMTAHNDRIHLVGFAPDGNALLTSCADGSFRIWHAATPNEVRASKWCTMRTNKYTKSDF